MTKQIGLTVSQETSTIPALISTLQTHLIGHERSCRLTSARAKPLSTAILILQTTDLDTPMPLHMHNRLVTGLTA